MDKRLKEAPCGFISFNHNGYITEVNKTFLEWTRYKEEDLLGNNIESLLTKVSKMIFHSYFYPSINLNGNIEELFINLKNKDNESVPCLMNARLFEEDNIKVIDCILVQMKKRIDYELELRLTKKQMEDAYVEKNQALEKLEEIYNQIEKKQTELMEINYDLLKMSNTDKLTGIANRRLFQERLEQQIELYKKEQKAFSLLIIDIDYFKKVNDIYGHQIGDIVIRKIANIIKNQSRLEDVVARFGGEEFTVILADTDREEAMLVSKKMNLAVEKAKWKEIDKLTVSIGVATFTDEDTEESIIKNADEALYYSKEIGRNTATHFIDI